MPLVANPIKYSRTSLKYDKPPPLLGEHTEEVLRGVLSKTESEIGSLRAKKII